MSQLSQKIRVPGDLTVRHRQILELLAKGETTQEIAMNLHLSAKAIEFHRKSLMDKTGLRSYQELTKLALRLGLAEVDV